MEKSELKERHFLLVFDCEYCGKTSRLHQLKEDFMGQLHCECKCKHFIIKKKFQTDDQFRQLRGKDRIVLKEITRVIHKR